MTPHEALQNKYAGLCRELGHLTNQKRKIEARLNELVAEIEAIDAAAAHIKPEIKSVPTPEKNGPA